VTYRGAEPNSAPERVELVSGLRSWFRPGCLSLSPRRADTRRFQRADRRLAHTPPSSSKRHDCHSCGDARRERGRESNRRPAASCIASTSRTRSARIERVGVSGSSVTFTNREPYAVTVDECGAGTPSHAER
jgi:hypothetical protein